MENIEIWKCVKGYEGIYEVSNFGRVKSLPRKGTVGKIMCVSDNGKGYFRIKLTTNNKEKRKMLHRIIAEAFILNPYNKQCVNHIDGNKKNNLIENLEWCTFQENIAHAWKIGLNENVRKSARITGKKIYII